MNALKSLIVIIAVMCFSFSASARTFETDSVEVYLIDSFVTPEIPHTFVLSFITSHPAKSKIIIENKYEFVISEEFTEMHSTRIDISGFDFEKKSVPYYVFAEDSLGNVFRSEKFEFSLPFEIEMADESNFLLLCLFGGTVFALPSPSYALWKDEGYFSLTKEIPLISLKSRSYNYAAGYFSVEYTHMFNAPVKNLLRAGYKHFFEIPLIEYLSPGLSGFTNFKGFNGYSPELSIGWFRIFNAFTVYTRYRFNTDPGTNVREFHEFSLGLYSGFFSIYF